MSFLVGMMICGILGFLHPIFAIAFGLGLLSYLAAIFLAMVPLALKQGHWKAKVTLPLVFMAVHAGFAWGSARIGAATSANDCVRIWIKKVAITLRVMSPTRNREVR